MLLAVTLLGPLTPGGALVSFALAAAALQVGATPAALTYVTSWSLFSLTKIIAYEIPFMGTRSMAIPVAMLRCRSR